MENIKQRTEPLKGEAPYVRVEKGIRGALFGVFGSQYTKNTGSYWFCK